jgi:hypothetical protein
MWQVGKDIPDVECLPDLDDEDQRWASYYQDLDHFRVSGMALGAIPLSEIRHYAEMIEYPDHRFFCTVIAEIDRQVLKESRLQAKGSSR